MTKGHLVLVVLSKLADWLLMGLHRPPVVSCFMQISVLFWPLLTSIDSQHCSAAIFGAFTKINPLHKAEGVWVRVFGASFIDDDITSEDFNV